MLRQFLTCAAALAILPASTLVEAFSIGRVFLEDGTEIPTPYPNVHQDLVTWSLTDKSFQVSTPTYGSLHFEPHAIKEILDSDVNVDRYQGVPEYHFDDSAIEQSS